MRYQLDERGSVIPSSVELSIDEIKQRGWLYQPLQHIPMWAHHAVQKQREAYEAAAFARELDERFGPDRVARMNDLRARHCGLWAEICARQPQVEAKAR